MIRHRDLGAVVLAAVICAAAALVIPVGWLSLLALAPLAFFLTGYAIQSAAFVEGPQQWPRAFWLSLALSLATLALLPLPLNFLGGLTPATWAIALVLVVLVAAAIAAGRRPADWSEEGLGGLRLPRVGSARRGARPRRDRAGRGGDRPRPRAAVERQGGRASPSSRCGPVAEGARVRIGIGNEEQHYTPFRVRATFGVGPGGRIVSREISLEPGRGHELRPERGAGADPGPRHLPLGRPRPARRNHFRLPYRRVYGWIPAGPQE